MRYFIYLQYDGTRYHGWQRQPDAISVQQVLEEKLSMLLRRETFIVGAGRTDTGVHARLMVAHFETDAPLPARTNADKKTEDDLCFKLNGVLPPDISIQKIVPVRHDAHARFSPTSRTYRYYVTMHKSAFNPLYVCRLYWDLDVELMNQAAAKLLEYTDFTSFAKLHTDVKTNICHVSRAEWYRPQAGAMEAELVFVITADRFLRNMVRAIVGTLMMVGKHKITVEQFCRIIEGKDRCIAGDSAPAGGLFLEEIEYPDCCFDLNTTPEETPAKEQEH